MENKGVYRIKKGKFNSIYVLGDLHGDLDSFKNLVDKSKENELVITLGDYTDRGKKGVGLIETLREVRERKNLVALKGNHESYTKDGLPKFSPSTFVEEVKRKKGSWESYFESKYKPFLESLYIGAILEGRYLFVHGGITSEIKSLNEIVKHENEVKWSDPIDSVKKDESSKCKGCNVNCPFSMSGRPKFGIEETEKVCNRLNVERVIRSHQPRKASEGPAIDHEGRVITVNSTSVHGGEPFALRLHTEEKKFQIIYKNGGRREMKISTQD